MTLQPSGPKKIRARPVLKLVTRKPIPAKEFDPELRDDRLVPPGRWSRSYNECSKCGTKSIPHLGKGLCVLCYQKAAKAKWYRKRKDADPNWRKVVKPATVPAVVPQSPEGG